MIDVFMDGVLVPMEIVRFPGGERMPKIYFDAHQEAALIWVKVKNPTSDDLIVLAQIKDILDSQFPSAKKYLDLPYFPYARQDRRTGKYEPHSMRVIGKFINSLEFDGVTVVDPHSDVVEAIVNNLTIIPQEKLFHSIVKISSETIILAPDAGSLKKIYKCAALYGNKVVCANKIRDTASGKIVGVDVPNWNEIHDQEVIIIDDIIDGGRSFIEISKFLEGVGCFPRRLNLYATHGIFSNGKSELNLYFDRISCAYDWTM